VVDLEKSQPLQDAVLSVHHSYIHTFGGSAVKLIENHLGSRYVVHGQQIAIAPPGP
jgi:hypothetical protein